MLALLSKSKAALFLALAAISTAAAEQRRFSAEGTSVERPASLPSEVVAILAQDSSVREILESEQLSADKLPTSWFLASEVHLNGPRERDLVVVATGLLTGANVTTYWIFRPQGGGFKLLLSAPAHTLVIKKTRSNGFNDIELLSATAVHVSTVLFRFQGGTYRAAGSKEEDLK